MAVGTPMMWRRGMVAIKAEATEGTAIALTATEATMKVENPSLSTDLPFFSRAAVIRSSFSKFSGISGGPRTQEISFDVLVAGSGTKDTAPSWGPALIACGFAETVTGSTSVAYNTASSSLGSATVALYVDGKIYKIHGARGNVRFSFNAGEPNRMSFTFKGVYNPPTDGDLLSPTYESTVPPAWVSGAFSLDSQSFCFSTMDIDMQNNLVNRPCPSSTHGILSVGYAGRDPVGSFDPEETAAATYDIWDKTTDNNEGALTTVVGATTGNIITYTAPKVQFNAPSLGDREGIAINSCSFDLNASSGDDEFVITQT
ncbi:MAG: hypothetical protein U9Q07_04780 [Planctomycetota bacterium]|nr:hypothetical protein [Planctomycetota bacterium]